MPSSTRKPRGAVAEILLLLAGGERRAVLQAKGAEVILTGDGGILAATGNITRVTKDTV